ncbi:MAG: hypothetical protein PUQ00_22070 [Nostoc sp. S13]|nr:hypothetical protein [Nostoc sp. S13]
MPHAPCPMPHSPCPIPHAPFPMPKNSNPRVGGVFYQGLHFQD